MLTLLYHDEQAHTSLEVEMVASQESDRKDTAGSSLLTPRDLPGPHGTALVLTHISSFQLHLEHLTVASALVQRSDGQGKLSTSNGKEALQAVALG